MNELSEFLAQLKFRPELEGCIGIERERFLISPDGCPVPESQAFLAAVQNPAWTYELSACQVEDRTDAATDFCWIKANLLRNDNDGIGACDNLGLRLACLEVAPETMPLAIYPEPRYRQIAEMLSRERLSAACRVTGTHIHVGVRDAAQALEVYGALREHVAELCRLGDHSQGLRLELYKAVAPLWNPPHYRDERHFFEVARAEGFERNLRNCWHLVRITCHGTVECRMFGVTTHVDEVIHWAATVRRICNDGRRGRR